MLENGLITRVQSFKAKLIEAKTRAGVSDFPWYPYGSLDNIGHVNKVMPGGWTALEKRLVGTRVADIGAADGELAFFLEDAGIDVDIIDNGPTNFNGLKGALELRQALGSDVRIFEIDLDQKVDLPDKYEFVFFLGLLYHLKNPFYILELLARHSKGMFISTRVCTHDRIGGTLIRDIPAAYLVNSYEANNDATNFWMFTHAGLRRILDRTGWTIRAMKMFGATERSDPFSRENDERAFAYLESQH